MVYDIVGHMLVEPLFPLVFTLLASAAMGVLFTPLAMRIGFKLGLVDMPGGRREHEKPTPRSGGLAVFSAFQLTLYFLAQYLTNDFSRQGFHLWHLHVFIGSSLVLSIGMIDDRFEIRPSIKLLGQFAAAALAWRLGLRLGTLTGVPLPEFVDFAATVFLYLTAMNAYNLIDGMDGVASGLGAVTAVGLAGLNLLMGNLNMAAAALALAGACIGFLRYNFHPARIFLGDAGSMLIGFLLLSLALGSHARSAAAVLLLVPVMTLGVPMIDTVLAIWRRSVRKALTGSGKVSVGDRDHLHHRLARRGLTQRRVAGILYGIQAALFGFGLLWVFLQNHRLAIFNMAFFAGSFVLLRYVATLEMSDSGRWIVDGIRKPGRRRLFSSLMPVLDVAILLAGFAIVHAMGMDVFVHISFRRTLREITPLMIGGLVILLWATHFYRPMWSRARAVDYFYFCLAVVAGTLICLSLSLFPQYHTTQETLIYGIVYLAVTGPFLVGMRLLPRLAQDLFHFHFRKAGENKACPLPRALVYGAGYGYTLLSRAESFEDSSKRRNYKLLGLIDDDPMLAHLYIHGHEVLGSLNELPRLIESLRINEIMITTTLKPEHEKQLLKLAGKHNLKVMRCLFEQHILREASLPEGDHASALQQ